MRSQFCELRCVVIGSSVEGRAVDEHTRGVVDDGGCRRGRCVRARWQPRRFRVACGHVEWVCDDGGPVSATVTMLFNTLAPAFQVLSGMEWIPQQGWVYRGGNYTIVIGGYQGVFAETGKADVNALFSALVGE